jgi:pimeloyl-ACP methyl ester carboxylesterase
MRDAIAFLFLFLFSSALLADGPADNQPDNVRRNPPPGIKIPDADRDELTTAVADFGKEIEQARKDLAGKPLLLELLPDVLIYHKAVDWALKYDEFYDLHELKVARDLLDQGKKRLTQLKAGRPEWPDETGLVVRGYQSKIDGSVQPYGLVVPRSYSRTQRDPYRLDIWCHGRGEKLTELAFIDQRQRSPGEFTPRDAFVLHPYGRYCNAFKFAGEVDVFEALEHCKKHYPIDDKRLVMRGFSMGGAACWQFAVHYPDKWCAATPGAGFAETPEFLNNFQNEQVQPAWWEKKLWHWYNATDYAENLYHCPTIAYSGENDKQKQAADVMAREMDKVGLKLRHIIGPKTGHTYHPTAKAELNRRLDVLVQGPAADDNEFHFTTFTLHYAKMRWLTVDGLQEQWQRASVHARLQQEDENSILEIKTKNVTALTLDMEPPGINPAMGVQFDQIRIDGVSQQELPKSSDGWQRVHLVKNEKTWTQVESLDDSKLHKKPGLQGPIDDAFMESFLVVKPSEQSPHQKVNAWVDAEMNRFLDHWRRQFRGIARVKMDKEVTDADIANHNLIIWGVPASNRLLKKITDKLPIKWAGGQVHTDKEGFDADTHVPLLIYPNPLNPQKYIVLNSGFTFRDYDYLNNARQVPKLPDWAVVDITTPPNSRWPGRIAAAGFFGENWEWKEQPKK